MASESKVFSWEGISRFRQEIMGVAILLVLVRHCDTFQWGALQPYVKHLVNPCAAGVDILLFVSGVGLYFSLCRNPAVLPFYGRRFMRLVPEYLVIAGLSYALMDVLCNIRGGVVIWLIQLSAVRATFVPGSGENETLWYILFIVFMYLLYPAIHFLFHRQGRARAVSFWLIFLASVFGQVLLLAFWPELYTRFSVEKPISRIPIFILGAYMGQAVKEGRKSPVLIIPLLFFLFLGLRAAKIVLLGHDELYGQLLVRTANQSLGMAVMLMAAWCMGRLRADGGIIRTALAWCGRSSLELYLFHSFLFTLWLALPLPLPKGWPVYFIVIIPLSVLLSILTGWIKGLLRRRTPLPGRSEPPRP